MLNTKVELNKYVATWKQDQYLHELQCSKVDKECLAFLLGIYSLNVIGAWQQSDGTYIVQMNTYDLPREFVEKILKEIKWNTT